MTKKEWIDSQLLLKCNREDIIQRGLRLFQGVEREDLANQVSVSAHLLRKSCRLEALKKSDRPSRHSIIVKGLQSSLSNSDILKRLIKVYPEHDQKILKQRICEYRWFYNETDLYRKL